MYRVDYVLSLNASSGQPSVGYGWGHQNPSNRVVAFLWHQGEGDFGVPYLLNSYSSCLSTLISNWRGRYGNNVPFIAGTYSYSQQGYWAETYMDFYRYNFGRGLYGTFSSGYYAWLNSSTMPVLPFSNLGLADSYYYSTSSGALVPSVVPYDPATPQHFSVLGYQARSISHFRWFCFVLAFFLPFFYF